MPKDIIPAISVDDDTDSLSEYIDLRYANIISKKTGKGEFSIMKRPTFALATDNSASQSTRGRGIIDFQGEDQLMVTEASYFYNGGSTVITGGNNFDGNYMAKLTYYSQAGTPYLVIQNAGETSTAVGAVHGNVYYATDGVSAATRVTDADMPGNNGVSMVRGAVNLDGYLFVGDIFGQIHNCALDDITTWAATDYLTAEREADIGVYIGKLRDHVVFFGTRSIEFFYNASNASGSPLNVRKDIFYDVGCYHPNGIHEDGDITYFVGKPKGERIGIYMLKDFQLSKVSNDFIDEVLWDEVFLDPDISDTTNLDPDVWLSQIDTKQAGKQLVLTVNGKTYVMDTSTGLWSRWFAGSTPTYYGGFATWTNNVLPIVGYANKYVLFLNGMTATINEDGDMNDLGLTAADVYFYTRPWDMNTNERKKITSYRILHYPDGRTSESASNLNLNWINTDFTSTNGVDTTTFTGSGYDIDLASYTARQYRGGITRQRIHLITLDGTKRQIIKGIEIDYVPLRG